MMARDQLQHIAPLVSCLLYIYLIQHDDRQEIMTFMTLFHLYLIQTGPTEPGVIILTWHLVLIVISVVLLLVLAVIIIIIIVVVVKKKRPTNTLV